MCEPFFVKNRKCQGWKIIIHVGIREESAYVMGQKLVLQVRLELLNNQLQSRNTGQIFFINIGSLIHEKIACISPIHEVKELNLKR